MKPPFPAGGAALLAALSLASTASAAPVQGPAGDAFYTPPSSAAAAGPAGELLSYRPTTLNLGDGAPAHKAWTVLYRSTDAKGQPEVVSGTIAVPSNAATNRPMVSYAFGTQGLAPKCAPSRQLVTGTEYEKGNISAALAKGYAVVASDYSGYTTGTKPKYTVAADEGHSVLDIARAAKQLPGAGITAASKTAIWGYSIGGQSAAAAGELWSSYAPDVKLIGVAAGGVPADLKATAHYLNKSWGAAFFVGAILGLKEQYPEAIPFDELANSRGQQVAQAGTENCVFQQLNALANSDIADFTTDHVSLDDLLAIPSVDATVSAQQLGTKPMPVPFYDYHGQADQMIPIPQAYDLKRAYCSRGQRVQFDLYPGEHLTTQIQAAPYALSWIGDRFAGRTAPSSCGTNSTPASTAAPGGGDQIVNLNQWSLAGKIHLATLNTDLSVPPVGTIDAVTNLTQQTLAASIKVPPFTSTIKVFGIPVQVAVTLVPTGPVVGTAMLDDEGQLHLRGDAPMIIRVESLGVGPIKLGTNCRTSSTVHVPVMFDGSVASLGDGTLGTYSTATFPSLTGCYLYSPILTALMSGPGQKVALTFSPPAPVREG